MSADGGERAWQPRTNSVNGAAGENSASEESGSYQERVAARAAECVERFVEKYPERAMLPVSRSPGRALRSELVDEEYVEEYVDGDKPGEGYVTRRLERAEPVTWAEALYEFLTSRQKYDDGLRGKFRDTTTDESFTVDFNDCWTPEYGTEQEAKNFGAQRQLMGGTYPETADSARSGEYEEGIWSDDIATVLLTRTGSSVPDGRRVPPVDHTDEVARTWSDAVYDVVRNVCEYHLGLDSSEWGFVRGDDVHGIGEYDGGGGENACYAHSHDGIYLDLGATDLRDEFATDAEIASVLQNQFYGAIEKHLDLCELAEPAAHSKDESVEVKLDLIEPAGYATGYLSLDEDEPMMEREVEMQAFVAIEWATNRQRIARSQLFTEAAKADRCKQSTDHEHGSELTRDGSGHGESEIVCRHCGSGIGIEAESLVQHRLDEAATQPAVVADGGQVAVGARIGESTPRARVRAAVAEYVDEHGVPESIPEMLGELGVPPILDVVEEVFEGESSASVEPVMGQPRPPPTHEFEAVVQPDGSEEPASAGGGVDTTELVMPETRLLEETRLQHFEQTGWETSGGTPQRVYDGLAKIVVEVDGKRLKTYNPETAASWLVSRGYRRPWHAELALSFTNYGDGIPDALKEPDAQPPYERKDTGKDPPD